MNFLNRFAGTVATSVFFLASAAPSQAASVLAFGPGVLTNPLSGGVVDFNTILSVSSYGQINPQGTFTSGNATFSGSGILMSNAGQSSLGLYAEPYHDATQYLAVGPSGSTEAVSFNGAVYSQLGLFWGSMDTYNSIDFYLTGTKVDSVSGTQAAAAALATAQGLQGDDSNNRFILISGLLGASGFDSIMLNSAGNSFEIDNLAFGNPSTAIGTTPLPSSLPLLATALGAWGLLGWRRKKKTTIQKGVALTGWSVA